ncbi:MAG: hypothetical protein ACRC9K_12250 [Afipia sp.]
MKTKFYVINEENNTSANDDGDGESFETLEAANARAQVLAKESPGDIYEVTSTVGGYLCPIGEPEFTPADLK